jgi:hypothetical protein
MAVLDFLCCDPVAVGKGSGDEDSITCSTDEGILECDYETQVTKLYHAIEERQWEEVLYFLETGNWYSTSVFSVFTEQGDGPSVQAKTWVTALDEDGNVRWCQLPLHAAVTFLAPFAVISKLIEVYPKSIRCADDQDMLPLHYAFRFGAEDDVLVHLLDKFPQAVGKKAVKDRLPLDLAQYGPRPERGAIIDYYMQSAVRNAKAEWDHEYEKMVSKASTQTNAALQEQLDETHRKLADALSEVNKTTQEVQLIKREAALEKREAKHAKIISTPSMKSSSLKSTKSNSSRRTANSKSNASKRKTGNEESDTTSKSKPKPRRASIKKKSYEPSPSKSGFGSVFGKIKSKIAS